MSENRARMARALAERGFRAMPAPPPMEDVFAPVQASGLPMVAPGAAPMPRPMPPRMDPDGDTDGSPNVNHDETNDDDASWEIGDSFTPEGLSAAAGEGARWWGEILKPIATAGGAVIDSVRQFGENMQQRDEIDRGMSAHYMPQIRQAGESANSALSQLADRTQAFAGNLDSAESKLDSLMAEIRGPGMPLQFRGMPAPAPYASPAAEDAEVEAMMAPSPYGEPDAPIDPRQMTDEQLLAALRANGARRAMR